MDDQLTFLASLMDQQFARLSARVDALEASSAQVAGILTQQLAALDALKAAVFGPLNAGAASESLHASVDAQFAIFRALILKGTPHPVYLGHFETERAVLQLELQPEQAALHAVPDVKH